jgi:succinate dehydrogenase / fumarate reductase flavoprotein subunit
MTVYIVRHSLAVPKKEWTGDDVELSYEDVDTSLIPPRPRLYGLVGAEDIEKVWKERAAKAAENGGNGAAVAGKLAAAH